MKNFDRLINDESFKFETKTINKVTFLDFLYEKEAERFLKYLGVKARLLMTDDESSLIELSDVVSSEKFKDDWENKISEFTRHTNPVMR